MSFRNRTIEEFVQVLASKDPVPGGGGASALTGAIGAALGNMVGSLTVGKKKYAGVEADMLALQARATGLQEELLRLMDADAEAFAPLAKAYGIPRDDPDRPAVMESALRGACGVPMDIMRACDAALDMMAEFAAKGSLLAVSDAGVGAKLLEAALAGASFNVFINAKAMADRAYAEELENETRSLVAACAGKADSVCECVLQRIRSGQNAGPTLESQGSR